MLKLVSCKYEGVPKFKTLEIADFGTMTSLTGPNGSGKTSILKVLQHTFELIDRHSLADNITSKSDWFSFTSACLQFSGAPKDLKHFEGYFASRSQDEVLLGLELFLAEDRFEIKKVSIGDKSISFLSTPCKMELDKLKIAKIQISEKLDSIKKELATRIPPQLQNNPVAYQEENLRRERLRQELNPMENQRGEIESQIALLAQINVKFDDQERSIARAEAEDFLSHIGLPRVQYVDTQKLYEELVPKMIDDLMRLKKKSDRELKIFEEKRGALGKFIQAKVDVFEDEDGKNTLTVNGIPYTKLSSGTQISVAFFAGTHANESDYLILWDEPKNGLHPTRRVRLLELMLEDKRQFILATHASELTPMLMNPNLKAYRCEADSYEDHTQVGLSVHAIVNRRDAFVTLEAMGVNPARILFTANVVIWIEGPTELLFYRHWLVPRLMQRGLHEGFHYTFMQYGGSLIAYLEVADESGNQNAPAEFKSAFDLLSLCRHPIIIVDSDLKEEPKNADPRSFLKKGAVRILEAINQLNADRENAGLFNWTRGREVENYLPEFATISAIKSVWKSYINYESQLKLDQIQIERYDSFEEKLGRHFIAHNVVDKDRSPRGRSLWGNSNKVEMMRCSLNAPNLKETDLKWECSEHLWELENFIAKVAEK
ncbi:AAA family ATPase [Herbaspirillum rubrisubalbicans]|uniref:ATPase AAA-type core domain-containing protein n=1 Tax=Herbaspirillum rubrisubalbicans TaxID=80842 RepID=A0AAD0U5A7_9BURK|nr:AAA family ATPase [Herbaspirillum rubrisubalbicans]AYR23310.1 hypothetical protein RC54_05510 [Herbaspirillum rubrisubalbicans]